MSDAGLRSVALPSALTDAVREHLAEFPGEDADSAAVEYAGVRVLPLGPVCSRLFVTPTVRGEQRAGSTPEFTRLSRC